MCSNLSVGLLESSTTLCMYVHASVGFSSRFGSPMRGSAPLAGKSCVTDMFSGLVKLLMMPSICVPVSDTSIGFQAFLAHPCTILHQLVGPWLLTCS